MVNDKIEEIRDTINTFERDFLTLIEEIRHDLDDLEDNINNANEEEG